MNIKQRIAEDMKTAMREKDSVRLDTIRLLRAAIQRKEIDERKELADADVLAITSKLIKQCQDAAGQFDQAGRKDLSEKERLNISFLSAYLPEQLTDDELENIISEIIEQTGAESMREMGKVMAQVKSKVEGRADMGKVSERVKLFLN